MYPEEIETWKLGEDLPDWITNVCKVKLNSEYKPEPVITPIVGGGFELTESGLFGGVLVKTSSNSDYVAKDIHSGRIFSLSEEGLNLMYKIKE